MKCSFCIVPTTRGREVSRPFEELVAEVEQLAAEGVREVTLLGQNVNSYGTRLRPQPRRFSELLQAVDAIDGIDRVRYTSPHPAHMTEDVIRAHAELESVCQHIHLPLQSGSSRVLKRMRRTYGRERFLDSRRADPRARPGLRADDRHHRRLPGRPRPTSWRRSRSSRRSASTAPSPSSTRRAARRGGRVRRRVPPARAAGRAHGAAGRGRPAPRARAVAAVRRSHPGRARRGRSRHDPSRLRGRTTHNKVVNFDGLASAGEIVPVEIAAATSQTLSGSESLLSRRCLKLALDIKQHARQRPRAG